MINPFGFLTRKVRGFRILDIAAVALILTIAVGSYAFKTFAGAEDADANSIESRILQDQKRIRLLQAEITRLDTPRRIEALSSGPLGLGPVTPDHEITADAVARIAVPPSPTPPPATGAPTT